MTKRTPGTQKKLCAWICSTASEPLREKVGKEGVLLGKATEKNEVAAFAKEMLEQPFNTPSWAHMSRKYVGNSPLTKY